jgi:putative effector of murein hydrolase
MNALPKLGAVWVYLAASPLLGLTITLIACLIAQTVYAKARFNPFANPVLIAVAMIVLLLKGTDTSYATYFEGARFVHFLFGPATVALALPLYRQWPKLRTAALPLLCGLVAGSLAAIGSAVGVAALFGASHQTVASLAPKSATTPIAMAVAAEIGGIPSMTAVLVISTGIFGAVFARSNLKLLRVDDTAVSGFARRRFPRHRHGPGISDQRGDGSLRRTRDGAERRIHRVRRARFDAAGSALAGPVVATWQGKARPVIASCRFAEFCHRAERTGPAAHLLPPGIAIADPVLFINTRR